MRGKIIFKPSRNGKDCSEYYVEGRRVTKAEYDEAFPPKPIDSSGEHIPDGQASWNKEVVSDGCAVHPKRIKEAEALCRKHGVITDFSTKRGRPIFTSRAHRKQVLKIFKLHDNNGGYGD